LKEKEKTSILAAEVSSNALTVTNKNNMMVKDLKFA